MWCGVWRDVAWRGVAWSGVEWCGVVWCGVTGVCRVRRAEDLSCEVDFVISDYPRLPWTYTRAHRVHPCRVLPRTPHPLDSFPASESLQKPYHKLITTTACRILVYVGVSCSDD